MACCPWSCHRARQQHTMARAPRRDHSRRHLPQRSIRRCRRGKQQPARGRWCRSCGRSGARATVHRRWQTDTCRQRQSDRRWRGPATRWRPHPCARHGSTSAASAAAAALSECGACRIAWLETAVSLGRHQGRASALPWHLERSSCRCYQSRTVERCARLSCRHFGLRIPSGPPAPSSVGSAASDTPRSAASAPMAPAGMRSQLQARSMDAGSRPLSGQRSGAQTQSADASPRGRLPPYQPSSLAEALPAAVNAAVAASAAEAVPPDARPPSETQSSPGFELLADEFPSLAAAPSGRRSGKRSVPDPISNRTRSADSL